MFDSIGRIRADGLRTMGRRRRRVMDRGRREKVGELLGAVLGFFSIYLGPILEMRSLR